MARRPDVNAFGNKELDNAQKQFDDFESQIKSINRDTVAAAPKQEVEQQTKLSSREIANAKTPEITPYRRIGSKEAFNEKFRDQYNFAKEKVKFIAENKEMLGESIDLTTKPFPGMPVEFWKVPCNTPIVGPRYLAEQIKRKFYSRFVMDEKPIASNIAGSDGIATYTGRMVVEQKVQRLDAYPVSERKSIFMGEI